MKKFEKIKKLKETLPLFWNSYQHMYDVRERNSSSKINFLLIVATFLPLLSLGLYELFNNHIILIPILLQVTAIIILLTSFEAGKYAQIHWFKLEKKEDLKELEEGFEVRFISKLKELERGTWIRMYEEGKIIVISRHLVMFSLFSLMLSILFTIVKDISFLYILTIILMAMFIYALFVASELKKLNDLGKGNPEAERIVASMILENWLAAKQK